MQDIGRLRCDLIIDSMLTFWASQPGSHLNHAQFAADPKADQFIKENLAAFLVAASIDRGGQSLKLWNIPYQLRETWGHFDTKLIQQMDPLVLATDPIIARAPSITSRIHLAKTIISVAQVVEIYGGDPHRIFDGSIQQIFARLTRVFGVGPGIARMIVLQRLLFFDLRPSANDELLPKLDVHLVRVFERTGLVELADDLHVRAALRRLNPEQVAIVDQAAWTIGQNFCYPKKPNCNACPLDLVCEKRGVVID
jgi:hypothetical protein